MTRKLTLTPCLRQARRAAAPRSEPHCPLRQQVVVPAPHVQQALGPLRSRQDRRRYPRPERRSPRRPQPKSQTPQKRQPLSSFSARTRGNGRTVPNTAQLLVQITINIGNEVRDSTKMMNGMASRVPLPESPKFGSVAFVPRADAGGDPCPRRTIRLARRVPS